MDALRSVLNNRESQAGDEERGILSDFSEATTLSRTTRFQLFAALFCSGIFFSLLGTASLFFAAGLSMFASLYTLGNLASIGSTMFLMGPMKQIKNMFDSDRAIASLVMIASLILTLVAALVVKSGVLALVMVIIQSLALTWYTLSYIPYARGVVISCFKNIWG